ncbi:hypothetical protein VPHK436_0059 [Vibrio phage K436]
MWRQKLQVCSTVSEHQQRSLRATFKGKGL